MKSVAPVTSGEAATSSPQAHLQCRGREFCSTFTGLCRGSACRTPGRNTPSSPGKRTWGGGLITSSQGWSPTLFPAGESGAPCYSWQGESLGCHSQSAGQGWGELFCFPAGSFLPCYASPSLLRGFERKQALLGSVSVSSVISGWQASFDSESGIYEMKTNLRELTTVSFLASPARLPFLHLLES